MLLMDCVVRAAGDGKRDRTALEGIKPILATHRNPVSEYCRKEYLTRNKGKPLMFLMKVLLDLSYTETKPYKMTLRNS